MTISDTPPAEGEDVQREIEWTDPLTKRGKWVIRPYIGWMNGVNQFLADKWKKKVMHVYLLDSKFGRTESWIYEPGQKPSLVQSTK